MDDMDGWDTARHVRAAGFDRLPIIIVSANVFENQADRLREAGCQGFVGKPVIESELIAALERHLGLEWLVHTPAPPVRMDAPPQPGAIALPEEARAELLHLAQIGHVRGLQQALDRIAAERPELAAACTQLRGLVSRFELDQLRKVIADDAVALDL